MHESWCKKKYLTCMMCVAHHQQFKNHSMLKSIARNLTIAKVMETNIITATALKDTWWAVGYSIAAATYISTSYLFRIAGDQNSSAQSSISTAHELHYSHAWLKKTILGATEKDIMCIKQTHEVVVFVSFKITWVNRQIYITTERQCSSYFFRIIRTTTLQCYTIKN